MSSRVVRAIAEAMFDDVQVVGQVEPYLGAVSLPVRVGLRLALLYLWLSPLLHLTTLVRMPLARRRAWLAKLERAGSLPFVGWRSILTLLHYEAPHELVAMGYSERRRIRLPMAAESGVRLRNDSEPEVETAEVA